MTFGRLLATVMLAGCLAAPATTLAAEPTGTTLPWNILDCGFIYGTVTLPAALLADRMPHNFRPFAVNPALANSLAQVGFEANVCEEGSGVEGQVSPMLYASTWTPVIAPPSHAVAGVGMFVNWDVLIPDDDRRAMLQAAGTPAHDGSVSSTVDLREPQTLPFVVEYSFEGAGAFRFDVVPHPPSPTATAGPGGEFAQYTQGEDGSMTFWRTKWLPQRLQAGTGTITLDPASWQAQAFGTTQLAAQFQFGQWDYTDGKIVLPN